MPDQIATELANNLVALIGGILALAITIGSFVFRLGRLRQEMQDSFRHQSERIGKVEESLRHQAEHKARGEVEITDRLARIEERLDVFIKLHRGG